MNWFTGIVLFVIIWWTALFAVLPIGTRPVSQADEASGWRGAPERPRLMMKVIVTTIVACVSVDRRYVADPERSTSVSGTACSPSRKIDFLIFKSLISPHGAASDRRRNSVLSLPGGWRFLPKPGPPTDR